MKDTEEYKLDHVVWVLTTKCNLKCIHCRYSVANAASNELSTKESLKICNDLSDMNCKDISLTGGEPFIRKDWEIIAREIKYLGMKLSIISNGFLIDEDTVSKLTKINVDSIAISLDGATAKTHDYIRGVKDSFKKVMQVIKLLKDANITTSIVTTVNKLNFGELPLMKDLVAEKQVFWQIQPTFPENKSFKKTILSEEEYYSLGLFIIHASKEIPVLASHNMGYHSQILSNLPIYPRWYDCQAGISLLGILSNGDVTGCCSLPNNLTEGNIRDRSIIEIWNDPNAFAYNRRFKKEDLGKNCRNCKYGESCRGGCPVISKFSTDSLYNDPYCFYRIEQKF